jgi:hypothetical protein
MVLASTDLPRTIGSYRLFDKIGSGGMGSVHLGRLFASGGFRRIVAIKRLHPQFAEDADFVGAFLDEARLSSRIHHPNVVAPLDVVASAGEVFLVFEHIMGLSLSLLVRRVDEAREPIPPRIAVAMMVNVLHGLHAAHEARGDDGEPLGLIHRDISPQNILIGKDGSARLLDFGIAKATGRAQITAEGIVKGKRGYMAPEHLMGRPCRASDIYSASVVLWEMLARQRLFAEEVSVSQRLSGVPIDPPSSLAGEDSSRMDAVVLRGLAHRPEDRFESAREMAIELEASGVATAREVGEWVERVGRLDLEERARRVAAAESFEIGAAPEPAPLEPEAVTATAVEPAPRRRFLLPALAALLLAGAVLAAFLLRPKPPVVTAPAEPPPSAPVVAEVEPPASAPPAPEPPATKAVPSARPHATHSQKRAPDARCKPWFIDKDGRKQFNEACLR